MLISENSALIVIDIQGKLINSMHEKEALFENLQKLIKGTQILGIPTLATEQNPERLGSTLPEIACLFPNTQPISKLSFSCCGSDCFMQALKKLERKQILIAGVETHVCIYQTAMDLINLSYEVQIVVDAVSSRKVENKQIGLEKIRRAGATLTSTEMALFELLKVAEGAKFKEIIKIIK